MWMLIFWVCNSAGAGGCDVHEVTGRYSTEQLCNASLDKAEDANTTFRSGTITAVCVPAPDKDPMVFE